MNKNQFILTLVVALVTVRGEARKKEGSKILSSDSYDDQAQKLNEYPQIREKFDQSMPVDSGRHSKHPFFIGYTSSGRYPTQPGNLVNAGLQGNFGLTGNMGNPVFNQGVLPGYGQYYPQPCYQYPQYPSYPSSYPNSYPQYKPYDQQPHVPYKLQESLEILERFSKTNNDGSQEHRVVLSNGLNIFQKVQPYDKQQIQPLEGYYSQKLADNSYLTTFYKIDDKGYFANSEVSDSPPNQPNVKEMKALPMTDDIAKVAY